MSNRIYVACLASYNNGVLHGAWIDASSDVDAMQDEVNVILRASKFPNVTVEHDGVQVPSAEEWAIHDHEGEWLESVEEYSGLKTVAKLMALAEAMEAEFDEDDAPKLHAAYVDHFGAHYVKDEEPADTVERIRDAFQGRCASREAWAEEFCDSCGYTDKVPEALRHYIDFDSFARDAELNGEVEFVNDGGEVLVFSWN